MAHFQKNPNFFQKTQENPQNYSAFQKDHKTIGFFQKATNGQKIKNIYLKN